MQYNANFSSALLSYDPVRYKVILALEESGNPNLQPYNDGKGFVTIGIGFN
jgi:hypothetical protein